jgi:transposase
MSSGRKITIENHLSEEEIDGLLKEFKQSYMIYRRLLFLKSLKSNFNIKEASNLLGIRRETGSRWLKLYNEQGFDGLIPNYENCGRKPFLTKKDLNKLKEIISSSEEKLTLKTVGKIIKDKFGVDYSEKQVWVIVREKLGFNYGKPFLNYSNKPENPEEDLKKT